MIDYNTTIYYRIDSDSGYEDSFPSKPSKWEFTYEVFRLFTASKHYADWWNENYNQPIKECTLRDVLNICPLPEEVVYDILIEKRKKLFNIYEEIKRNKNTGKEWWEFEKGYQDYEKISEEPAKDSLWYKPYTYEETNFLKILKKTLQQ